MKIRKVAATHVAIPYQHGGPTTVFAIGSARATMDSVYVRVDTDEGVTGWGEAFGFGACPVTVAAVERVVAPLAIGRDTDDIAALLHDIRRRVQNMGHNGPVGFALSGFDTALWDIAGKQAGQPIHRLLGGAHKSRIPAYASLLRLNTPEHVRNLCAAAMARGYRDIKLHERTVETVAAAREVTGPDLPLMLDTNCTWTVDEAIEMATALRPFDLTWLEEPLYPPDDHAGLARIRREGGVPTAAGENLGNVNDFRQMLDADAVDFMQPDTNKIGGITEMRKAIDLARARGVAVDPHSPFYGPGLIATLHLIAAMPEQDVMGEFFYADLEASPIGDIIYPRDGYFAVPDGPGLGIEVDEKILQRYRVG
jgi:D-galactarolactone cycloisomerase